VQFSVFIDNNCLTKMPELVKKVNNGLVKRFNIKINKKLGLHLNTALQLLRYHFDRIVTL